MGVHPRTSPLVDSSPKRFTTDVFTSNPFAKTIYRRVGELPAFAKEAEEITLQMGVIAAVEYVLAYMEELQLLRERLVPDNAVPIRDDAEEEQLRLKISRWRSSSPTAGYFRTLRLFSVTSKPLRPRKCHANFRLQGLCSIVRCTAQCLLEQRRHGRARNRFSDATCDRPNPGPCVRRYEPAACLRSACG